MIETHIDLGQLLIASLIAVVGWFIANQIADFKRRIEQHDKMLISLVGSVQRLIGIYQGMNGSRSEKETPWPNMGDKS